MSAFLSFYRFNFYIVWSIIFAMCDSTITKHMFSLNQMKGTTLLAWTVALLYLCSCAHGWEWYVLVKQLMPHLNLIYSYNHKATAYSLSLTHWGRDKNRRHFADDIFNRVFDNENFRISIAFSLKCVPKGPINNIPALVQIMAWRRPGDKPLSESMMVSLPTHICVTRPQWVKLYLPGKQTADTGDLYISFP